MNKIDQDVIKVQLKVHNKSHLKYPLDSLTLYFIIQVVNY